MLAVVFQLHAESNQIYNFMIDFSPDFRQNEVERLSRDHPTTEQLTEVVLTALTSSHTAKILFNAKTTLRVLLRRFSRRVLPCFPLPNLLDPQIAAWVCDPDDHQQTKFQLPLLLRRYCNTENASAASTTGVQSLVPEVSSLSDDLTQVCRLWSVLHDLMSTQNTLPAFNKQEMPLVQILAIMQINGVAFDGRLFANSRHLIAVKLREIEDKACALLGRPFLLTSPEQVSRVLFEELKLERIERTDRGRAGAPNKTHASTSEEVLVKLSKVHPLPALILEHRGLSKRLTTYMDPMTKAAGVCVNPAHRDTHKDKLERIHSTWNQILTGTGRLSSSKPNLQSLPRSDVSEEVNIRDAFVASDSSRMLLTADYSQMEMRILALKSQDANLIKLFADQQDGDIYKLLASKCFNIPVSEVSKEAREKAKTVSLGIIYGMGPASVAEKLSRNTSSPVSLESAKQLVATWHATFPSVKVFIKKTIAQARRNGYVTVMSNRRRYFPNIKSPLPIKKAYSERQCVNTVIQGSAADMVKRAMIRIQKALYPSCTAETYSNSQLTSKPAAGADTPPVADMVLQIHDEVVMEVPLEHFDRVCGIVRQAMEGVLPSANVAFPVNLKYGPRLGSLQALPPASSQTTSSSRSLPCTDSAETPRVVPEG